MLVRFDPFGEALAEFERLARGLSRGGGWMPADAYRMGDRFFLHLDLPGIDPESIDLTVEKGTLTVSAERVWSPGEEASLVVHERPHGTFRRSFLLGEGLDVDRIEAGYDHGVLTVTIPLADQAKPRKITVGTSERALTG